MTLYVCCDGCGVEEPAFKITSKDPLGQHLERRRIRRRETTLRVLFDADGPHHCAKCGHELKLKEIQE